MGSIPITDAEMRLYKNLVAKVQGKRLPKLRRDTANAAAGLKRTGHVGMAHGTETAGAIREILEGERIKIEAIDEVLETAGKAWTSTISEALRREIGRSFDAQASQLRARYRRRFSDPRHRGEEMRLDNSLERARSEVMQEVAIRSARSEVALGRSVEPGHVPQPGTAARKCGAVSPEDCTDRTEAALRLFYSYAREDETLRNDLDKHLALLKREGVISAWYDRMILPGTDFERDIDEQIETADIILLLISADFLDSDYCYCVEFRRALERHDAGSACVVPVILRSCRWKGSPIGKLQALPRDGKPVASWENRDEALTDVANGIAGLACKLRSA